MRSTTAATQADTSATLNGTASFLGGLPNVTISAQSLEQDDIIILARVHLRRTTTTKN